MIQSKNIRSPIVVMLAHVDHGKTSLLDKMRGTAIAAKEIGGITQQIGCSFIPLSTIQKICGNLLQSLHLTFTIPGLLMVDSPGHAAFSNLRKRGGNLADIAILVIDINEGFKPQTFECIEILKTYKTPFVIALNKIDLIKGFTSQQLPLLQLLSKQSQEIQQRIDTKLYEVVGRLSELGFNSERFDRISDFTKEIAIVPSSAKTGDGISELLMVLAGLSQKYFEQSLKIEVSGFAKGTILEVNQTTGLGTTLDTIIYDGTLKVNDTIVIGSLTEPIVTKVKAILLPPHLKEMRDKKIKFSSVREITAAVGIKISAPEIDSVVAGMPLQSCKDEDIEKTKEAIQHEVEEVLIETDREGIIIKADSLGSLEAVIKLLKEKNIPIKKASIGMITKKDLSEAESMSEKDPLLAVVLGFNIPKPDIDEASKVHIIVNNIIYKLIDDFISWQDGQKKSAEASDLASLTQPCKIELLKGYVFRQNNPAVVGVHIITGIMKVGTPLMNKEGERLTEAKSMQLEQESISEAAKGKQVAVSLPKVTIGRQLNEGEILYSALTEEEYRKFKDLKKNLKHDQIELLKEIAAIYRKKNPVWGV